MHPAIHRKPAHVTPMLPKTPPPSPLCITALAADAALAVRTPVPASRKSLPLLAVSLLIAAFVPGQALAQTPPTSGQLLEETRRPAPPALPSQTPPRLIEAPVRPTLNMPDGVSVTVSEFRIVGAT